MSIFIKNEYYFLKDIKMSEFNKSDYLIWFTIDPYGDETNKPEKY